MIPHEYVTLPLKNVAEVTLLGAGAYGESTVCHVGEGKWIIIDSCINPDEKDTPLPLLYLNSIGVSPDNIVLIICTHWHDDHIKGLSKILEEAKNSDFCISRAHDKSKFLRFVGLDAGKSINSSTKEFTNCLEILKSRGKFFLDALEDRPLLKAGSSDIICLSPSDYTTQQHDVLISELITEYGQPNKKIPYFSPNSKSIVIFAKLGYHRAILGADLEIGNNNNEGWLKVIKNTITIDKKSSLIKISHHGSENGYHIDIWNNLLSDNPVSKITPWKKGGNSLPEASMVLKYLAHTNQLYMTEIILSNKQKERDSKIEKLIKQFKPNLQEIKYKLGIIRSRINMDDYASEWQVENILRAKKMSA